MRRGAIFWGGLIILIGVILLLNTLGILSGNIWGAVFSIFIIALGAWILWGTFSKRSYKIENISVSLGGASRAKVRIQHGAGRLEIKAGAEDGCLVSGTCAGGANIRSQINGELLEATLSIPDITTPWFGWGPVISFDWSMSFVRRFPFELALDTGATETRMDLSDLMVSKINLNSGASSTRIILPANAGLTTGSFKTGAAALELIVPANVAARIRASGGLASITVDRNRFPRNGSIYQSLDYDSSTNRIDIQVETGVGSVDIR